MYNTIKKQIIVTAAAGLLLVLSACNSPHSGPNMIDYSYIPSSSGTTVYTPQQSMEDF